MQTHIERPEAKFFHYVLPAMASQLLTGFFIIVDGFYIGQSIGDVGLASINLLWPVAALITAIGLGVGTGGSVVMANALGAHDEARALQARGTHTGMPCAGKRCAYRGAYGRLPLCAARAGRSGRVVAAQRRLPAPRVPVLHSAGVQQRAEPPFARGRAEPGRHAGDD